MRPIAPRWIHVLARILGIGMIVGGSAKLLQFEFVVRQFQSWSLAVWFLMLVGTFEVVAGALAIWPRTRPFGMIIFATILVGAGWTHTAHGEWPQVLYVSGILAVALTIAWRTRHQAASLLRMT